MERRREIAVISTMGATARSITSIFVIEGAIVGLVGALAGVLLGAVAVVIANRFDLITLPADVRVTSTHSSLESTVPCVS